MLVAFRKAKTSWNPISKIIGWLTGPYCHVEFVFDKVKPWTWFGAVLSGLRFTTGISGNPKKWDFVKIDVDQKDVRKRCRALEGSKYDVWGVLSYILPVKQDPRMYYCSEVVYDILVGVGRLRGGEKKVHPSKLYKLLDS